MSAQHTPGPWRVTDPKTMSPLMYPQFPHVETMGGRLVAEMSSVGPKGQANAQLVAAAPELLEALKRVRHAFYVDGSAKALRAAFEGTKELVAKAEGRT